MKTTSPEYLAAIAKDPLMRPTGADDPLLRTKEGNRLDLQVGERIACGTRRGTVVGQLQDPIYPVRVLLDGDQRETRPIFHSMRRMLCGEE